MNKFHISVLSFLILIFSVIIPACDLRGLGRQNQEALSTASPLATGGLPVPAGEQDGVFHLNNDHIYPENGKIGSMLSQLIPELLFDSEKNPEGGIISDPIRIYFTKPNYPYDPDRRVKDIIYAIIGLINKSENDLAIAIYMLDLDEVGQAILAANQRGVRVRLVTDEDTLKTSPTMQKLKNAGISIVGDRSTALMHHKFMVIDKKGVWSGSYNWTPSCTYRNDNGTIYIESKQLAEDYLQEFDEMYYNTHFGEEKETRLPYPKLVIDDASIEVCFSPPGGCGAKVVDAISRTQKSIRFMAFAFTSDPITKALIERYRAGIDISGVIEAYQSDKPGGDYSLFRSLGMDVLLDGNPYNMHHKVFILDEETVILGSYNFTRSADTVNDENMLLITDHDVAALFFSEYERIYAQAQNPTG